MDNLKSPASPAITYLTKDVEDADNHYGFTKLELASLMIAQGNMAEGGEIGSDQIWAARMVALAKAVLEECNK
jgi:hypothetical protein